MLCFDLLCFALLCFASHRLHISGCRNSLQPHQPSCQELAKTCQDPDESQTVRKDTPHINHRLPRGIAKPGSGGRRWSAARHLQSAAPSGVRGVPDRNSNSSISSPDAIAGCRRPLPGPAPKSSKSRFFEGPFFGPFFGPPFSGLGSKNEITRHKSRWT